MSGQGVLVTGIGLIVLSVLLLTASFIYRGTAGRKIRMQLLEEYE